MHLSTATAEEPEGCDVCGAATGAGQKKKNRIRNISIHGMYGYNIHTALK
ncbi:hypothetical protein ACKS0A_03862 [Histoplasma ohiense]